MPAADREKVPLIAVAFVLYRLTVQRIRTAARAHPYRREKAALTDLEVLRIFSAWYRKYVVLDEPPRFPGIDQRIDVAVARAHSGRLPGNVTRQLRNDNEETPVSVEYFDCARTAGRQSLHRRKERFKRLSASHC